MGNHRTLWHETVCSGLLDYSRTLQPDFDTALTHYQEAKQLIEETGYHLRDAELDLLAAQICLNSESKDANYYLQKAKNRIEEIGQ